MQLPCFRPRWLPRITLAPALALCLGISITGATADERQDAVFEIRLGGIRAATLTLSGLEDSGSYRLAARIETSGAAQLLARFAYRGEAEGRRTRDGFAPHRYAETADTGRRQSAAVVAWRDGLPQVEADSRTRLGAAEPVAPADTFGTLDPLTALWSALRDRPPEEACGTGLRVYDGARLSRIVLGPPEPVGRRDVPRRPSEEAATSAAAGSAAGPDEEPGIGKETGRDTAPGSFTCRAEYRRLAGFPEEEMRRRTSFPMRLEFEPIPGDNRVRVSRVTLETLRGPAELIRRR